MSRSVIRRQRAVFLDRDGVINAMCWNPEHGTVDSPTNPNQFHLLPGVGEAIQILNSMVLLTVVVSNQPGIAKGKMVLQLLEAITWKMHTDLATVGARVDATYYCLHHPDAVLADYRVSCNCRKPKPGLLQQAATDWGIDLVSSYMIGDGTIDVQAGQASGCMTIWLGSMKCTHCQMFNSQGIWPHFIAADLLDAARLIQKREEDDTDLSGRFC